MVLYTRGLHKRLDKMLRFHWKRLFAVGLTLIAFFIFVTMLLRQYSSETQKRHSLDPELIEFLREQTPKPPPQRNTTHGPPQIHMKQLPPPVLNIKMPYSQMENQFFKFLENKAIRCQNDQRLGNQHDGGWNVCLSPPFTMKPPCIVFSFGIGYDWQFDDSISKIYGCRVLAFDPSMYEPDSRRSPLIEFKRIGIGAKNEVTKEGWLLKTLGSHLRDEGYWGVPVDYVKIDIEYTEWEVLKTAFAEGALKYVKQLGFEAHTKEFVRRLNNTEKLKYEKLSTKEKEMHDKLDFVHMYETLHQVEIWNFRKFNYRKNPFGNYRSNMTKKERSCCYELHYLNVDFLEPSQTILYTKDSKIFH